MTDQFDQDETQGLHSLGTAQPLHLARVLLIGGQEGSRFRIGGELKQAGAIVDCACDLAEASASLTRGQRDGEPYDLAVLDLSTAGEDGYDVARGLREAQHVCPILALTSRSPRREGTLAVEAGCDELIQMPVANCVLLDAAATLVNREKTRRFGLAEPDEVTSELSAYPELMMMLRRFVSNLPEAVEAVLAAQRERDIQQLRDELDQLKRNATSHGYLSIRAAAVHTQQQLDDGRKPDAEAVKDAIDDLVDLCRRATASPGAPPPPSGGPPLPPSG